MDASFQPLSLAPAMDSETKHAAYGSHAYHIAGAAAMSFAPIQKLVTAVSPAALRTLIAAAGSTSTSAPSTRTRMTRRARSARTTVRANQLPRVSHPRAVCTHIRPDMHQCII